MGKNSWWQVITWTNVDQVSRSQEVTLSHKTLRLGAYFRNDFFHCNSNSTEISFCSHLSSKEVMTMKFCTWHNSCAVIAIWNILTFLFSLFWLKCHCYPNWQGSRGQHGAHLGSVGPSWARVGPMNFAIRDYYHYRYHHYYHHYYDESLFYILMF